MVLSLLESLTVLGGMWTAMGLLGHVPGKILPQGKNCGLYHNLITTAHSQECQCLYTKEEAER